MYIPTIWTDETPEHYPVRYTITEDGGVVVAQNARIDLATAVIPGTPLNADNLNHIEQGLVAAHAVLENANSQVLFTTSLRNSDWIGQAQSEPYNSLSVNGFGDGNEIPTSAKAILLSASARWAAANNTRFLSINSGVSGSGAAPIMLRPLVANFFMDGFAYVPINSDGVFFVWIEGTGPNSVYLDIWGYVP